MTTTIKISQWDFDKIRRYLGLHYFNDSLLEITFKQEDLNGLYYDEYLDDYIAQDSELLVQEYPEWVVDILNKYGLTDALIKTLFKNNNGYYQGSDRTLFKFNFEIDLFEVNEIYDPFQLSLFQ